GRMRPTHNDGDVELLLDLHRQLFQRVMHAGQRRERDQPRVVGLDGADQVGRVGDEEEVGLMTVRFQDAGEVGNANRLLDPVVLDEENFHQTPSDVGVCLTSIISEKSSTRTSYRELFLKKNSQICQICKL